MATSPWSALVNDGRSSEKDDPVWYGALAWSGSFRLSVGLDNLSGVRISGGYNPYDFAWTLKLGESLDTPIFYTGYTARGMGDASRRFHAFQRANIIPGRTRAKIRPMLYNSWEATTFNVTEAGQMALAEKAAKIGVEPEMVNVDSDLYRARPNCLQISLRRAASMPS